MTELDLDKILIHLGHRAIVDAPREGWDEIIAEAKAQIIKLVEGVIGEDEEIQPIGNGFEGGAIGSVRAASDNALRQKQRARLKALGGGDE